MTNQNMQHISPKSIKNRFIIKLRYILSLIKFETLAFIYSLIGLIKVRLFFKKGSLNNLEIGVGNSPKKPKFITLDLSLTTDYPYDLRIGMPFPDNSIDMIYSEHVLEHFQYRDLINLLHDCYRVLKPNGIFSAAIPNARIYLKAYFHPDKFNKEEYCTYDFGLSYKHEIDYVNYIAYMGGSHHYMFDDKNIISILNDIGFRSVKLRSFIFGFDKESRMSESIYVEGKK